MSLKERLGRWALERETKRAQKHFAKVAAIAWKLRMPKKERRAIVKTILRGAGWKKIRIKERA